MPNTWFASDTHLNHRAPVERGWRPFSSVEEMNECIITRWNETVSPRDQVWLMGDVFLGNETAGLELVRQLQGEKHLIMGNHDVVWSGNRDGYKHFRAWLESFETIQAYGRRRIAGQTVMMSHFPFAGSGDHTREERYNRYRLSDDHQSFLIHGHVHEAWKQSGRRMLNVGVDVWDYRPVSIDTVAKWITGEETFYLPAHEPVTEPASPAGTS